MAGGIKRILHGLRLGKIAAVDFPCQEGAIAVMLKRKEDSAPGSGAKLAKGLGETLRKIGFPVSAADEQESAEAFDEILQGQEITQEFWDAYYRGTQALERSLLSIIQDDAAMDKTSMIAQSLQQFTDYIEQTMPGDVGKSLAAGIAASAGQPGTPLEKGEPMSTELKKALGLPENASDADCLKALALKDAYAGMTSIHKAFMENPRATLPDGGKDAFAKMSVDERDAYMKAKPCVEPDADEEIAKVLKSGNAFRATDGTVILKAQVGDAVFAVLKSQNDLLAKQAADLAKSKDREELAVFAKRAVDAGLPESFGDTLRKAYAGDAAAQTEMEKRLAALTAQIDAGDVFKSFGHSSDNNAGAAGELAAKVAEVRKALPNLTYEQAYTQVYTDRGNADIVKRAKQEAA